MLCVRNGLLMLPGGIREADLYIRGDKIFSVGGRGAGAEGIDAAGCWVFPGFVSLCGGPEQSGGAAERSERALAMGCTTAVEGVPAEEAERAERQRRGRSSCDWVLQGLLDPDEPPPLSPGARCAPLRSPLPAKEAGGRRGWRSFSVPLRAVPSASPSPAGGSFSLPGARGAGRNGGYRPPSTRQSGQAGRSGWAESAARRAWRRSVRPAAGASGCWRRRSLTLCGLRSRTAVPERTPPYCGRRCSGARYSCWRAWAGRTSRGLSRS